MTETTSGHQGGPGKMNWGRIILCGLIAGGIWTLLSVSLLALLGEEVLGAVTGGRTRDVGGGVHLFLLASNFAAGIWAMWLYAAIRPRFGPGPRTAFVAGMAWWLIVTMQSAKWVALMALPLRDTLATMAATLPAIIVAALLGAWPYEE